MSYKEEKIKVPRFNEESGFYTTKTRSKMMSNIRDVARSGSQPAIRRNGLYRISVLEQGN